METISVASSESAESNVARSSCVPHRARKPSHLTPGTHNKKQEEEQQEQQEQEEDDEEEGVRLAAQAGVSSSS